MTPWRPLAKERRHGLQARAKPSRAEDAGGDAKKRKTLESKKLECHYRTTREGGGTIFGKSRRERKRTCNFYFRSQPKQASNERFAFQIEAAFQLGRLMSKFLDIDSSLFLSRRALEWNR
jgi:hypothetical protein